MRAALLVVVVSAGCVKSNSLQCGEVTCPAGTHCGSMNECIPDTCGNNQVNDLEECDGEGSIDQDTLRCADYGFYRQTDPLTCSETCTVDTSVCRDYCGDNVVNGSERCDGVPPSGFACSDFGFDVGTIGCASGCTPAFDFCSNIGWQLVPGGGSDELYAVHLASPNAGVAVGRAGQIIAAKDGVWLPVIQSVTTEDLNGIFANTDGIIAVGNGGTILRYDGTDVTKMASPTTANLRSVSGIATGALAVGDGGTILRFDGTTWSTMQSPTNEHLNAVFVVGPLRAYAVGANGTVLRFDAGVWTDLQLAANLPAGVTLYSVFVADSVVYFAGDQTTIARLTPAETDVILATRPFDAATDVTLRAVWGTTKDDVHFAGSNGQIFHWNGQYVTAQDSSTNRTIYALDGSDGRIVGVTRGGSVIAFNGTSRHVSAPTTRELYAVFTDGTRTVAAGRDLAVLRSDGSWDTRALATGEEATSVVATGNFIFTGTVNGLLRYDRQDLAAAPVNVSATPVNAVWVTEAPFRIVTVGDEVIENTVPTSTAFPQTSTTTAHGTNSLNDVWGGPDGVWFAVGEQGTALRRDANGTWAATDTGTTLELLGVWGTAADDVFAVGVLGTILHWNGTAWRRMYSGTAENLRSISGNTGSDIFVTGTSFTRLHYDGISWSRMAAHGLDTPEVAVHRGTTWYVSGANIERNDRVITTEETRCGDPFDNNGEDGTNCDDPDCRLEPQCLRGGACETLERVTCETQNLETTTFTGVARLTDLPCLDHSTPGPEASFRFVAETSGMVSVTIDDPANVLDVVATDAAFGHCRLDTCRPATTSGTTKTVTFPVVAGQMYYIVVDGPVGTGAEFTLSVSCS